jgi:hypothetical protein
MYVTHYTSQVDHESRRSCTRSETYNGPQTRLGFPFQLDHYRRHPGRGQDAQIEPCRRIQIYCGLCRPERVLQGETGQLQPLGGRHVGVPRRQRDAHEALHQLRHARKASQRDSRDIEEGNFILIFGTHTVSYS